jgi:hypothetical protein
MLRVHRTLRGRVLSLSLLMRMKHLFVLMPREPKS